MITSLLVFLTLTSPFAYASPAPANLSDDEKAWLDVVEPIITAEERRIFRKKLRNSRKRADFVRLFWAKRDNDLNDNQNPFRREYLARYDYVMANFDRGNKRPQSAKGQIFLLLGKPDRVERRVDFRLTGLDYSNPYLQYPPELWIYNSVGFDFPRKELRLQFVPTSSFGEYTALTDQLSWHFIRNLKYKFILNRDLKKAPALSSGSVNYQNDLERQGSSTGVVSTSKPTENLGQMPTTGITNSPTSLPSNHQPEPKPTTKSAQKTTTSDQPRKDSPSPQTLPEPEVISPKPISPRNAGENRDVQVNQPTSTKTPPPLATPKQKPLETKPLTVPPPETVAPTTRDLGFQQSAGNSANVALDMAFFGRDQNQSLLVGRLGVPFSSLDFQFNGKQYEAAFSLLYRIKDQHGRIYQEDRIPNKMAVPNQATTTREDVFYTKEITMLVPPGRYSLEAQVEISSKNSVSYKAHSLDVLAFTQDRVDIAPLVLLDPNIAESQSQIQLGGKPFGLNLTAAVPEGDRLFPLIEISGKVDEETLNTIEFVVLEKGEEIIRWGLYPEEITQTAQQTLWIHPILNTKSLEYGSYTLRFEMQDENQQWITRDKPFSVK